VPLPKGEAVLLTFNAERTEISHRRSCRIRSRAPAPQAKRGHRADLADNDELDTVGVGRLTSLVVARRSRAKRSKCGYHVILDGGLVHVPRLLAAASRGSPAMLVVLDVRPERTLAECHSREDASNRTPVMSALVRFVCEECHTLNSKLLDPKVKGPLVWP